MEGKARKAGINILDTVPWGTHISLFYDTPNGLIDSLVPYFKAGLENNEFCLWITSDSPDKKQAEKAMSKAVPDFSRYLAAGQMEVIPYTEWYLRDGVFDQQRVFNACAEKVTRATASGYDGFRSAGDVRWLNCKDWKSFIQYEKEANRHIDNYPALAICAYPLDKLGPEQVINLVTSHKYNLIRQRGELAFVASSTLQRNRETTYLLRSISQAVSDAVIVTDTEHRIIYANEAAQDLFGYAADEIIGQSPDIFNVEPSKGEVQKEIYGTVASGKTWTGTILNRRKDGSTFVNLCKVSPLKDERGGIKAYISIHRDATGYQQAKERQQAITKTAFDGFSIVSHDGRFLEVNDSYCRMVGYSREEMLQMSVHDFEVVENTEEIDRHIKKIIQQGYDHFEARHRRKDGGIIDVEINIRYLDGPEGRFFSFIRDITERKQAEARQKAIVQTALDGFWITNQEGEFLDINESYCRMTGYTREELLNMSIADIEALETPRDIARRINRIKKKGSERFQSQHRCKGGRIIDVELSVSHLKQGEGKLNVVFIHDITEHKRKEAELLKRRRLMLPSSSSRPLTRLQRRFIRSGLDGFDDRMIVELLASLNCPRGEYRRLAKDCIKQFRNLRGMLSASPEELRQSGLPDMDILWLRILREIPAAVLKQKLMEQPVFNSSREIFDYLYYAMRDLKNELFKVIYLNNRSQIIDTVDLFRGARDLIHIRPREIVEKAISISAGGLIFVHNHPTGDPTPSRSDKQFTRDLVFVGMILQMKVLDHIIIGDNCYFSFADDGLIQKYADNFLDLKIRGVLASRALYRNYKSSPQGALLPVSGRLFTTGASGFPDVVDTSSRPGPR